MEIFSTYIVLYHGKFLHLSTLLAVPMEEEEITFEKARFSFGTFIALMAMAGFIIALVPTILNVVFTFWKLIVEDPNITISSFVKPLLSVLVTPIEAVISGIIIFPVYKKIMKRNVKIGIKLYKAV